MCPARAVDLLSVVVAEDDEDDQMMLHAGARRCSAMRLQFFRNGRELLAFLGIGDVAAESPPTSPPNLIVTDLKMPEVGGLEVLRQVKRHPSLCKVPVIVLSGSVSRDDLLSSYALGAIAYVPKPHTYDDWMDVARLLHTIGRNPEVDIRAALDRTGLLRLVSLPG